MPMVPIENVGRVGIVRDIKPHEVPQEGWSNGLNMRFSNNVAEKIQGEVAAFGTPSVTPYWLLPWQTNTAYNWFYCGTNRVFRTDGTTHTVVTRHTTTDGDDDYTGNSRPIWSGGILHGVPIINHNNDADYPQQYDAALSPPRFKDLDNWPVNTYCRIMRPFRNFLIAFDVTKSGVRYPYLIKWSDPADSGAVPVSWDETDATQLAGELTIAQTGGYLVDAQPLADQLAIYKEDSIFMLQYIGGAFVFNLKEASLTVGLLAPRCVKNVYRQHIVVGTNDIVSFNGQTPTSLINKRMRSYFFNNISNDYAQYTFLAPNYPDREMWVCYVEQGAEFINKALIWSYDDNTWTVRDLPNVNHIGFGQISETATDTFDASAGVTLGGTTPDVQATFDAETTQFGESSRSAAELDLLIARGDGVTNAFYKANRNYDFIGTPYTSYLERTGLTIVGRDRNGNPKTDPNSVKFVRGLVPKITATQGAIINIYVGSHDTPDGAVTWEGPLVYDPEVDTRVDCRVQGKFIAVRFEDASTTVPWSLSGYELDLDIVARR